MPPKLDASSPDGKLRALSLDGGGFRGLAMLHVIDAITKAANKRNRTATDPQLLPYQIFDIIIGSSTGGLIAVLIGRLGLNCADAIAAYTALGQALYGKTLDDRHAFTAKVLESKNLDATAIAAYETAIDNLNGSSETFNTSPGKGNTVVLASGATSALGPAVIPSHITPDTHSAWTVKDVIRAATAAKQYLPAYTPSPAGSKPFEDTAYRGAPINPTIAAKAHWTTNTGILVNIGQWFPAIDAPANPSLQDRKPLVDEFRSRAVTTATQAQQEKVLLTYLKQADFAKKAVGTSQTQVIAAGGAFERLDPPLAPNDAVTGAKQGTLELVDVYHAPEIEESVKDWITANQAKINEIAEKLVKKAESPYVPPPPPDGTRDFNPVLSEEKPREMLKYLNTYHVIFIIDDSTSMIMKDGYGPWDDTRWRQAQSSLGPIADFTFKQNVTSVDMGFMHYNKNNPYVGIKNQSTVLQYFNQAKPPQDYGRIQYTPTGETLRFFLDKAVKELNDKANNDAEYKKIAPTDIIVLTDGEANDDPKSVLNATRAALDANRHNHNYIGVQFVQIGNSNKVKLSLADLVQSDIADLIPSDGTDLTYEKLARIMLGGNHPTVRRKLRADEV